MSSNGKRRPVRSELNTIKKFGGRVRDIRVSKGLTLEQCEEGEHGFPSWRNLSDIENGQNCTLLTIVRIAKRLDVKISILFKDIP